MSLLVVNIQRSSFYDGPGIRTVVFLKGCSLKCPWCCNPECISPNPQIYFNEEKCLKTKGIECNECMKNCSFNQAKDPKDIVKKVNTKSIKIPNLKHWIRNCPMDAIGIYGERFEENELIKLLRKDENFYKTSGGGVTFSGGECLLQANVLFKVLKELKTLRIHTCVETSLFCPPDYLDLVKDLIDLFIIDIKILDPEECRRHLHGDFEVYFKNVEKILKSQKACIFRFPAVKPFTFNESNIKLLCKFVKEWKVKNLEIFSVHNLAVEKYKSLEMEPPRFERLSQKEIEFLKSSLLNCGVKPKILTF